MDESVQIEGKHNRTEQLFFQGEMIGRVDDFKYFGSQISSNGNQEMDVEAQLQKATTAFKRLYRGVWKRRDIKLKTKFRVYRALIEPIALYEAESWTQTKKVKNKFDVFDNECIRTILGIK